MLVVVVAVGVGGAVGVVGGRGGGDSVSSY